MQNYKNELYYVTISNYEGIYYIDVYDFLTGNLKTIEMPDFEELKNKMKELGFDKL